ncbi:MAG: RbsD/FucU domain-containing protein [Armatimonadota bacterium]
MAHWHYESSDEWDEIEELEDLEDLLPALGHRNWIQIADMAFPSLNSPGVQTFLTDDEILPVLDFVLELLNEQPHIRPKVWLDAELDFVQEDWAQGITQFRQELYERLRGLQVNKLPHEQLIAKLSEASKQFQVVVIKTRTCLPYTSVFFELDCAYWDEQREQMLRDAMGR